MSKKFLFFGPGFTITIGLGFALASSLAFGDSSTTSTLDDLLKQVLEERQYQNQEFAEREKNFQNQKDKQARLLNQAQRELQKEEKIHSQLTEEFNRNNKNLGILQNELDLAMGVLGELFGVVKQVSGNLRGRILKSLVSVDFPDRLKVIDAIADSRKLPTMEELRRLWFELQREMTESAKVVRFNTEVRDLKGQKTIKPVIRVGPFNLVGEGQYLQYQEDTKQIVKLDRQPVARFTRTVRSLEKASPTTHAFFAIDPSSGSLLSILLRIPGFFERIKDGGLMGVLIILVLLTGLILALERIFVLHRARQKLIWQMQNPSTPKDHNPMGKLLLVYNKHKNNINLEAMDMKLGEVSQECIPRWERGIGLIKIFAALSPLMGLLGTVVGMIMTFQAITLFGTGDPKAMAEGISQALVTTMLGLCCAIPLLLLHTFVYSRLQSLIHILEAKTSGLLAQKAGNPPSPGNKV